jgi:hypothetical protein
MAVTRLIHAAQSRRRGRTYEDTTTAMASDSHEGSPGHPRWGGMRWWLALGAVVLVLGCIFVLPRLIYPPLSSEVLNQLGLQGKERLDARNDRLRLQNDTRAMLLQGVGGVAVLLTVYFTWRQLQHNLEATRRQQQATQDQIELSRQQQLTERFTRAIDQLGNESEDVRLVPSMPWSRSVEYLQRNAPRSMRSSALTYEATQRGRPCPSLQKLTACLTCPGCMLVSPRFKQP